MKILKDLFILTALFGGIWLVTSYFFSNVEMNEFEVLDKDYKKRLSEYLDTQFREDHQLYYNGQVDSAVNVILMRLNEKTGDSIDYKITLLKSAEVNAFATLEGRIYVFTGLIEKCKDPEMLAAVLAHEMGHIKHEHLVQRLKNEVGFSLLLSILTGGDPVMMSELGKMAFQLHFNREQEREADDYSRELLLNSEIDPIRFAQFMMIIKNNQEGPQLLSFLNTHPEIEERIMASTDFQKPEHFNERNFELDWELVLEVLKEEEQHHKW